MTRDSAAQEIARLLGLREEKVVFAESCTGGLVAATLAQIPGISKHLCGSVVTYHQKTKRKWLRVRKRTIKTHTSESQQVASEMAVALLHKTPSADWSVAVVGHLGPNAPEEKDGHIYVSCARRTKKGRVKVKDSIDYICKAPSRGRNDSDEGDNGAKIISLRVSRQEEAAEVALTLLGRHLHKKIEQDGKGTGQPKEKPKLKKDKPKKQQEKPKLKKDKPKKRA